jgi:hypothetical protein
MTTLLLLTKFSFLFCSLAALAAVAYFLTQLPKLEGRLRLLAVLNLVICAVSALLHLYYFTRLQSFAAGPSEVDSFVGALTALPLWGRYAYWMATTVMLILMFPLLIGIERVGVPYVLKLALADIGMIATGYLGEQSTLLGAGLTLSGIVWFGISSMFFTYMLASVLLVLSRVPGSAFIPAQRDALGYMFFFFMVGWLIFPAGFFYAVVFDSNVGVLLRELTVNLGDIVNKVLWGVLVVYAAREIAKAMRAEGTGG